MFKIFHKRDWHAQACDQEFSLNFKLLQRYIIHVIHPDAAIPSLADHRDSWSSIVIDHKHRYGMKS